MARERGGVYVQRGVDANEEPIIVHVDDLPALERDALRASPAVTPVVRETRGGLFVDAPDDPADPDATREPPKHVDDMTPEERDNRIGRTRGLTQER